MRRTLYVELTNKIDSQAAVWSVMGECSFCLTGVSMWSTGQNGSYHDISFYTDTSDHTEQEKHLLSESLKAIHTYATIIKLYWK